MSDFRCLALETGVRPPSVAACNGDRRFDTFPAERQDGRGGPVRND